MMSLFRSIVAVGGLLAAVSAAGQAPDAKALREAKNWETLFKLYPPRALAAREEGLVGFTVKLDSAGHPTECQVTHSSGHRLLDEETCQLILIHATFTRPPGLSASQISSHEGVVNWKLPSSAPGAVQPPPQPIAQASAPEKMICKRSPKIGSLAAFERTCMTRSQWRRYSDESKEFWEEQQSRKGATNGN